LPIYPDYVGLLLSRYLPLSSGVYFGIARRALDRDSGGTDADFAARRCRAAPQKPAVQRQIAQAEMKLEAASALVEALTAKEFVTTTAREVVDIAVQVVGTSSVSRRHELKRLDRDVCTRSLHPPDTDAVLGAIGAVALGQGPQPAAGPAER
jgi:alkylation response protein AidB-like acyl-CoA dehydrogenase